jgi:hypothetical protein
MMAPPPDAAATWLLAQLRLQRAERVRWEQAELAMLLREFVVSVSSSLLPRTAVQKIIRATMVGDNYVPTIATAASATQPTTLVIGAETLLGVPRN